MGGDQLVAHLVGEDVERREGDELRAAWERGFRALLDDIVPVDGAGDLLRQLAGDGWAAVLASSSPTWMVEHYVQLLDAESSVRGWTTADDAQRTKPEPDLVRRALAVAGDETDRRAVMVGDSTWDVLAARRIGLATVAVQAGGYGADELRAAGAAAVVGELRDLPHVLPDHLAPPS
jgi:HAD superfamily hydrolase (TIGR01509 family)